MRRFDIVALTAPALLDPSIAIAANRAGEQGVFDLEYARDLQEALSSLARLGKHAEGAGVKLAVEAGELTSGVIAALSEAVNLVVLVPDDVAATRSHIEALRARADSQSRQIEVWLETTSAQEARLGERLGVDGLVAKGHEAGGRVAEETAFVLMQRLLKQSQLPVWVHGGIGLHTAAACYAAGAAGVVLDSQLLLTREMSLDEAQREVVRQLDGSEAQAWEVSGGQYVRVCARANLSPVQALRARLEAHQALNEGDRRRALFETLRSCTGWGDLGHDVWLLGQDGAFAAQLAERFRTVSGVLSGFRAAVKEHAEAAALRPLDEGSPLAQAHGTRYPIVQGPMTRVSDQAAFAAKVAEAGGLPFLALALMRGPAVQALLSETRELLGERPFGVGILGFVPMDLREEQLAAIRAIPPTFALIAGGRPDQALALESAGTPTYLHVPSPELLRLFASAGARRFVFEGRECGGHVGPRSSFVLWNQAIETLLDVLSVDQIADCHVLFAGGIHDSTSAQAVAAMAAPLAQFGAKVGVLMGTPYLFTTEAVTSGAVVPGFQNEALSCDATVLLESGPGHATRCATTPFAATFAAEKRRLLAQGIPGDELRASLEDLNLGRLRLASKGMRRADVVDPDAGPERLLAIGEEEQRADGMYMIGQVAALRDSVCSLAELHHEVSVESSERLTHLASELRQGHAAGPPPKSQPSRIAIVGMSCILPQAPDLQTYWSNILDKVDAITEVPPDRWDVERYFDADREAPDKIYSRYGGFIDDVPFDPTRYGLPPNSLGSIEPLQLLTLEAVRAALDDAGYTTRPFARESTSVILGAGGGVADLGNQYAVRAALPSLFAEMDPDVLGRLPEWTEDSLAGILLNVAAGRVTNRFDLGGVNYTVDAACASSLAAVYAGVHELETGTSDMVVVGGVDAMQSPFMYLGFAKTQALSPTGRCRTFDSAADGIVISEGLAILVLKRLADAERDGDRVYAVIDAVAGSSDGRGKGLTAPRPEGQVRALERAYAKAGFSPATVGLIEAHGTGTVAGDQSEIESLRRLFASHGATVQSCALGSVKSMIGHTKCAAGLAGLIKAALALHHKVLPPTLHVTKPNARARLDESPFYVNTEARPWIDPCDSAPRRAGVSAFGFGGTNFHVALEEYTGQYLADDEEPERWPSELLLFGGEPAALRSSVDSLVAALDAGATPPLRDLAYTAWCQCREAKGGRLAIVATSLEDLRMKLERAREVLADSARGQLQDPRGVYYNTSRRDDGATAFLFPGQGSQYVDMLRQLSLFFPEVGEHFAAADSALAGRLERPLSALTYPPPHFDDEQQRAATAALTRTDVAQPALAAVSVALCDLLRGLGVQPAMSGGHSSGEYSALWSAGALDEPTLYRLTQTRGRCILDAADGDLGAMAAAATDAPTLAPLIESLDDVWLANLNSPRQTIIAGTQAGIEAAVALLSGHGIATRRLNVACAFHSPMMAPAHEALAARLGEVAFTVPRSDVYSNITAAAYPRDAQAVAGQLAEHLVSPVRFCDQIEAMYAAGARVFVEVGAGSVLTSLVAQVLGERPHVAVATDVAGKSGLAQLQHAVGRLAVHGIEVQLDRLFRARRPHRLDFENLIPSPTSTTTWMVNGSRIRSPGQPAVAAPASLAPATPPVTPATTVPAVMAMPSLTTPAIVPSQVSGDHASAVMVRFETMLDQFLSTQRDVMLTYLAAESASSPAVENGHSAGVSDSPAVPRFVLRTVEAPPAPGSGVLPMGAVFLITNDGGGVATALARQLEAHGARSAVVDLTDASLNGAGPRVDEASITALVESVRRRHTAISGVVHLAPLSTPRQLPSVVDQEIMALFYLVRATGADLKRAFGTGGWLLSVTAMGGAFAVGAAHEQRFAPMQGALAGLVKSLAKEYPAVQCKAVDLDPSWPADKLAGQIATEILARDGETEVGYRAGRRVILRALAAPLTGTPDAPPFNSDSVFFITGGARGVCAELACALAQRYRPRLVLAGRTPLEPAAAGLDASAYASRPALKDALIQRARASGATVSVAEIEAELTRLWQAHDVRTTLARIEAAGGHARYVPLDVRDAAAVKAVVKEIVGSEGRLDVAVHGAGVIEDCLVESKTTESFQRVFETKVTSALALSQSLPEDSTLIFMSSIAGRFGNAGQSDYAAANEVLNKLAVHLDARRRGRVVALEWGPWEGGMADTSILNRFATQGIQPIAIDAGCQAFLQELELGAKGDAEVIVGDGPWPRLDGSRGHNGLADAALGSAS